VVDNVEEKVYIFDFIIFYLIIFYIINDRSFPVQSMVLSNPGSLYNGQAYINSTHSSSNNHGSASMPVFKLPSSVTGSRQHFNDNNSAYQPAEFTLATFSPDKSINTPASIRSPVSGSQVSSSEARLRPIPKSMQKV
jgi:hypothetical protein